MQPDSRLPIPSLARIARRAWPLLVAALPLPAQAQDAPAVSPILAFSGSETMAEVTLGPDNRLYGPALSTTFVTGGLIYSTTLDGSDVNTVYQLGELDGLRPEGGLLLASDGLLYGTTVWGEVQSTTSGTIFRVSPDDETFESLFEFADTESVSATGVAINSNGAYPAAAMIEGSDGNLYGVTRSGGASGAGTVFRIARDGTGFSTLHEFAPFEVDELTLLSTNEDGVNPEGALVEGADGYFYGTAFAGGANGSGTIFRLRFDGTGFEVIHVFSETVLTDAAQPANAEGAAPLAGLIDGGDGLFYGTASRGGETGNGTVFAVAPDGSVITVLRSFSSTDGERPSTAVTLGRDGRLYGTTFSGGVEEGGSAGFGTIFSIARDGTDFVSLYAFTGSEGANPTGSLLQLSDDLFVGTVENGGACSQGAVFQLSLSGGTVKGNTKCGRKKSSGGGSAGLVLICLLGLLGMSRLPGGQAKV